jgi:hypothetical protein
VTHASVAPIPFGSVARGIAMAAAVDLRTGFDGPALQRLARRTKNGPQARRLLALAEVYDGGTRGDGARISGVTLQYVRDWVLRFNAYGASGLWSTDAPRPAGRRARRASQGGGQDVLAGRSHAPMVPSRIRYCKTGRHSHVVRGDARLAGGTQQAIGYVGLSRRKVPNLRRSSVWLRMNIAGAAREAARAHVRDKFGG